MARTHAFAFPLAQGMHARPASFLAEVVRASRATVVFVNERNGRSASAASVLGLVGTDTSHGDPCRLEIAGEGEAETAHTLSTFLANAFLRCDDSLPAKTEAGRSRLIPRSLRAAGLADCRQGIAASRGIGEGTATVWRAGAKPAMIEDERAADLATERARLGAARAAVAADFDREVGAAAHGGASDLLRAHRSMLEDPSFVAALEARLVAGRTAGQAVADVIEQHRIVLDSATSAYVRDRVLDLEDIADRLWTALAGKPPHAGAPLLAPQSILFADRLTPSQFLALDRSRLAGLVLGRMGETTHTLLLARSLGVPAVTAITEPEALGRRTREAIVDGNLGLVVADPGAGVRRFYEREKAKQRSLAAAALAMARGEARTRDGHRLEVGANIASAAEAEAAFAQGAEGIGLFRTELLFCDRATAPTEEEQYAAYAEVVRLAGDRPVIIRTLDAGGDKPVPYLRLPAETNPFLGYRGVRFYAEQQEVIKTQLRAILRAASHGNVRILAPMIACVEEARLVRRLLTAARAELEAGGQTPPAVRLGFMLEVPSAAFILPELCAEADFFSLGTNDLAQYFGAADRENDRVAGLNDPLQPAFIRLLRQIVREVRARGRWIGLCGAMAENAAALPLLVGLGLDEISVAPACVAAVKAGVARSHREAGAALLDRVAAAATLAEAKGWVAKSASDASLPMLGIDLVLDGAAADSKAEVIRLIVDQLERAGRTTDPTAIEEAAWQREETYATAFGDGFALPHCKSDLLAANSIVLVRLQKPVDWGARDQPPVDLVIFLGIRESDHGKTHLQTLARLSRAITREEFRAQLRAQPDAAGLLAVVAEIAAPPLPSVPVG